MTTPPPRSAPLDVRPGLRAAPLAPHSQPSLERGRGWGWGWRDSGGKQEGQDKSRKPRPEPRGSLQPAC